MSFKRNIIGSSILVLQLSVVLAYTTFMTVELYLGFESNNRGGLVVELLCKLGISAIRIWLLMAPKALFQNRYRLKVILPIFVLLFVSEYSFYQHVFTHTYTTAPLWGFPAWVFGFYPAKALASTAAATSMKWMSNKAHNAMFNAFKWRIATYIISIIQLADFCEGPPMQHNAWRKYLHPFTATDKSDMEF